jgi:undecaprenyl-diphosphatase
VSQKLFIGAVLAWLLVLAGAVAFSVWAAVDDELPGDEPITDRLQGASVPGEDVSDLVQTVTGTEVALATGATVTLLLWQRGYRRQAVLLGAGLVLLAVFQPVLKELVDRPRPDPELVKRRAGFESSSFPSGHVMSAAFLFGALCYFSLVLPLSRPSRVLVAVVCASFVVITPVTSVWLGLHWPSDVLGSWLWALVLLLPIVILDRSEASDLDFPERSLD